MKYNTKETEERIRKFWEKEKIYKFNPNKKSKVYSIDTPPPNISGNMHLGHAFSYAQQDFIVRFQRMFLTDKGQVFYPFGTDDNGLPTERLVERLNDVKSKEMSRKKFIELAMGTLKKFTPEAIQDWKNIGISADFDLSYSTIDKNSRKISQKSFIDLYKKDKIYKKDFPTIWCPECQTSIAQAELEDKEKKTLFSDIKFNVKGKDLIIATTRPELIPACVAVFVNPKDKRYKSLIGEKAKVPLFDYEVPIIGDTSAEMRKGTGAMMVCSYGDKYDVEAVIRHKLPIRIIFNKDGTLNSLAGKYKEYKIEKARRQILEDLKIKNLIKNQKQISHIVNVHDKCGTPIEFITTEQWFIKILDNKKKWIELGRQIKWRPDFMRKRYENWVNGLEWDWNISRDRYFGVPIPVWYCKKCNNVILPEEKQLPVDPVETKKECPKCHSTATPEKKVLDTWATSSLTPQIASSLVQNKVKIPFSLRPNAHDIIRTWAFYTIVKSYLHENKIPWENIIISGVVSLKGEKMSKSKGNIIEPKKILDEYGADALRFWASGSKLGEDLDYQEKDLIAGKKFVNKLLNASNFVFMNMKDYKGEKPKKFDKMDELFLAKIEWNIKKITDNFSLYEYSKAKQNIESLFWKDFCDNYLEIIKKRIYQGKGDKRLSAQYTLYYSLLVLTKMIAPIMPFITEEVYQKHFRKFEKEKSIHTCRWPEKKNIDQKTLDELFKYHVFVQVLEDIRKSKSSNKKPMNSEIILTLTEKIYNEIEDLISDLSNVANAKEIKKGKFKVEFVN